MAIAEGSDDRFDFSEFIVGGGKPHTNSQTPPDTSKVSLSIENEVKTSYLLVNALLKILITKGMIHSGEVNDLVKELHNDYLKMKGSKGNGTG
ncbi:MULTISPECIES: hypothetical protein [Bacillus subtilis group]|uniref:hypothetical protein n=1 Tax=Bacillus subtilis group TaxID=653685 RepID=UPI001B1B5397|nr:MULTISPECIES: hypothetical protein [Bacillus subtilis group]MED4337890.1 hypothetical protein [Bacillus licheniformis]MED4371106.1 hypothetical protein [Bacillus licheniformis]GIN55019.1 hypothetical protein J36TS2_39130 [Bacillus paralicheniformis]